MHIVLITTSFPDGEPGREAAGSFVADFARQLARHARVTVVAAASTDSTSRDGDVEVVRFAVPRTPLSLLRPLYPGDWPAILKTMRVGKAAVQRVVDTTQPDYLFSLWALPSGGWAQSVGRDAKTRYAVWALGSDIWSLGRLPLLRSKLRSVLRAADACFADGMKLAKEVEDLSGRDCGFLASSRRLPPPASNEKSVGAPYKLAYLGRWHVNKGSDLLLESLGQLSTDDWSKISAVRIFGGGPLQDSIERGAEELRDQGRPVETGGYLDKQGAADLIGWSDFLLLPSRIESVPVIFSDAVQLGTPIVATPVGDLPILFDKYAVGVLAQGVSAHEMANAIRRALADAPGRYRSGLKAAAVDFDIAVAAEEFARQTRQAIHA